MEDRKYQKITLDILPIVTPEQFKLQQLVDKYQEALVKREQTKICLGIQVMMDEYDKTKSL